MIGKKSEKSVVFDSLPPFYVNKFRLDMFIFRHKIYLNFISLHGSNKMQISQPILPYCIYPAVQWCNVMYQVYVNIVGRLELERYFQFRPIFIKWKNGSNTIYQNSIILLRERSIISWIRRKFDDRFFVDLCGLYKLWT